MFCFNSYPKAIQTWCMYHSLYFSWLSICGKRISSLRSWIPQSVCVSCCYFFLKKFIYIFCFQWESHAFCSHKPHFWWWSYHTLKFQQNTSTYSSRKLWTFLCWCYFTTSNAHISSTSSLVRQQFTRPTKQPMFLQDFYVEATLALTASCMVTILCIPYPLSQLLSYDWLSISDKAFSTSLSTRSN